MERNSDETKIRYWVYIEFTEFKRKCELRVRKKWNTQMAECVIYVGVKTGFRADAPNCTPQLQNGHHSHSRMNERMNEGITMPLKSLCSCFHFIGNHAGRQPSKGNGYSSAWCGATWRGVMWQTPTCTKHIHIYTTSLRRYDWVDTFFYMQRLRDSAAINGHYYGCV